MHLDSLSMLFSANSSQFVGDPLLLRALACNNANHRPPIWLMRQAGRSLPSYRKLRETYSLKEMFRSPELICTVTQLPVEHLGVDGAILFADILHVALLLGCEVHFPKTGGVEVTPLIRGAEELKGLCQKDVEETLGFVREGIVLLKKALKVPLIGFCGGPFTVATYLVGKQVKKWLYSDPHSFHALLHLITESTIAYLQMQIRAGVDVIQIFDSWAHLLSRPQFNACVVAYLKAIQAALPPHIPVIIFCRGSSFFVSELVSLQPVGISFDWSCPLWEMRPHVPLSIALQGNLDPQLLYAPPAIIEKETKNLLSRMRGDPGFIVNLGHGVLPDTPFEHIKCFVETVTTWQ